MTTWREPEKRAAWRPFGVELRQLMILGAPQAGSHLAQLAILTTDILMIGQLGAEPLAMASLGVTVFYLAWLAGFGPTLAVSPIVSQILGAKPGEINEVRDTGVAGLWSIAMVSVPLILALQFSGPFLALIGQEAKLAEGAGGFAAVLSVGLPFAIGIALLRGFTSALSYPNAALITTLMMIAVNAGLNYALIWGHWGAPELGLIGSAWASTITNIFGFAALLAWVALRPPFAKYRLLEGVMRLNGAKLKELFVLGIPMGLTIAFEGALFNAGVLIVGLSGAAQLAAHQIAINVASIVFMIPLGLALAATVRVGLHAGAGSASGVRYAAWGAIGVSGLFMTVAGLVTWVFAKPIAGLYLGADAENVEQVEAFAQSFMLFAALFMVFDGIQVAGNMALRGLKDANGPMWIAGISYWGIGFPVCWLLGVHAQMGGMGVWIGYAVSLLAAAIGMVARLWWLTRGAQVWRPKTKPGPLAPETEHSPHL